MEKKTDNNKHLHVCPTRDLNYTVVCSFSVWEVLVMSHNDDLSLSFLSGSG